MADKTTLLYREREWMLFVDGENLTKPGQETLEAAGVPLKAGPHWRRDVYLWLPDERASYAFFSSQGFQFGGEEWQGPRVRSATRSYYYTSTTSDEPQWTQTRLALRAMGFEPRLF